QDGISVLPGGPPVVRPRHLEYAWRSLDAFDAEPGSEFSRSQIGDEFRYGSLEGRPLLRGEGRIVAIELAGPSVGRHPALLVEGRQKILVGLENPHSVGLDVSRCGSLALLPLGSPEPGLGSVDDLLRTKEDPLGGDLEDDGVSLLQVGGLADLSGDRHLALGANGRSGHYSYFPIFRISEH